VTNPKHWNSQKRNETSSSRQTRLPIIEQESRTHNNSKEETNQERKQYAFSPIQPIFVNYESRNSNVADPTRLMSIFQLLEKVPARIESVDPAVSGGESPTVEW
jgi:hypothetical protein